MKVATLGLVQDLAYHRVDLSKEFGASLFVNSALS